jgi:hypothetical protein
MKYLVFLIFSFSIVAGAHAQSTRDVQAPRPPAPQYQSYKKESKIKNFIGRFKIKKEVNEVEEFRERVNESYKEKAKEEKKADKPRFKDPTYFGHRKPPKKRPPGKQKYCKQCQMRH